MEREGRPPEARDAAAPTEAAREHRVRHGKRLALVLLVVLVLGGPLVYWRAYRSLEWSVWIERKQFVEAEGCAWTVEVWANRFRPRERIAFLFEPDGELALSNVHGWQWLEGGGLKVWDHAGNEILIAEPWVEAARPGPGLQMSSYGSPMPDPFYVRWPKLPLRTDAIPYPLESPARSPAGR